jgi:FkbM family methyltransferase
MITDLETLVNKFKITITGISHFGAHFGQELDTYNEMEINNIHFFEPQKEAFNILNKRTKELENVKIYNVGLGSKNFKTKMYSSDVYDGVSASVLKPTAHNKYFPEVVFDKLITEIEIIKYDDLNIKDINFLNIDIQGYELEALKGSKNSLKDIDAIYTEVSRKPLYEKSCLIRDLDRFLKEYEFIRVNSYWHNWSLPHGEAFYVKKNFLNFLSRILYKAKLTTDYFEIKFILFQKFKNIVNMLRKLKNEIN